jgi:hypothetical protein
MSDKQCKENNESGLNKSSQRNPGRDHTLILDVFRSKMVFHIS